MLRPEGSEESEARRRENSAGGEVVFLKTGSREYEVSDAALAQLYEDPEEALQNVKYTAYDRKRRGKTVTGVRLSRVRGRHPLRRLGLRSGDVITSVDGDALSDAEDLEDALSSLEGEDRFTIRVYRRRREIELTYDLL